ncbi:MAG: phosphatidylinositol mannoside acyltransferase [Candidatus Planktophila sp.]|nr:phosphatidylinositol mannoside acyltransferase [Candidatus Planktophila sp.]
MKENISALIYFAGWRIVRWLPEEAAYKTFFKVADLLVKRNGKSVQRLRSNLARTQSNLTSLDLEILVVDAMRSYMRYWCDTFRFPDWSQQRVVDTVSVTNEHLLMNAVAARTGVIVALPHAGNWDHAGAYFCAKGVRLVTVAERLKPEKLFLKFLSYRQSMGMEVLPLDGRVLDTLTKRVNEGALVALVADRDLSRSGINIDFFGGPARMPAGPALLALKTKAPLITAFVSYTDDGIHIEFNTVVLPEAGDESEMVQEIVQTTAQLFESGIKKAPQDWHMLQRIWVDGDFKDRSSC